jgi:hypothetical protein
MDSSNEFKKCSNSDGSLLPGINIPPYPKTTLLVVFGPLTDFLGSNIKGNWQFDICYDIKNPSFSTKIEHWGISTVAVVPEPGALSFLLLTPLLFLRRR